MSLNELRKEVDRIDRELISFFAKRARCVLKIALFKKQHKIAVFDEAREDAVLKKIEKMAKKHQLDPQTVKKIFAIFMSYCRSLERDKINSQTPESRHLH